MVEALLLKYGFDLLMKPPKALDATGQPQPQVQEIAKDQSFADLMQTVLKCYHRTARYTSADIIERPWSRQAQYNARASALVRIEYRGVTGARYQMNVGMLAKPAALKTVVQTDSAQIPASNRCALADWVPIK